MPHWADRAEQELADAYNNGELSDSEYQAAMRDLRAEVREAAQEAADEAYDNVMGRR